MCVWCKKYGREDFRMPTVMGMVLPTMAREGNGQEVESLGYLLGGRYITRLSIYERLFAGMGKEFGVLCRCQM